jgi:hypothetical protein
LQRDRLPVARQASVGETVARSRPAPETRLGLTDRRTSPIPDPELRDESKGGGAKAFGGEHARDDVWDDHLAGPRRRAAGGHGARKRAEDAIGVAQEESADRPPLGFVGVEQLSLCRASRDKSQFPAEVPGVLNAGVHPLRAHGAVNVRRVAGEEHAPLSVVLDLPMM